MKIVKSYNQIEECSKCKGKGIIPTYLHRQGGVCYECGGSGKVEVEYKINKNFGRVEELPSFEEYMTLEEKESYENAKEENGILQVSMRIYKKYNDWQSRIKQITNFNKMNEKQYQINKVKKI